MPTQAKQSAVDLQEATAARALFRSLSTRDAVLAAHALGKLDHPSVVRDLSADASNRDNQHCTGNPDKAGLDAAYCFGSYTGKADGKVIKADIEGLTDFALRTKDQKIVAIIGAFVAPYAASGVKIVSDAAGISFNTLRQRNPGLFAGPAR